MKRIEHDDHIKSLISITKSIANTVLEKREHLTQQDWKQLCDTIERQLKYIEIIEQNIS